MAGSAHSSRARSLASLALVVIATMGSVAGTGCLYVRTQLLDGRGFSDRTVAALEKEPVRRVVAREIVVQVLDRAEPDLLAARPLLTSAVEVVVSTKQFRGIVHALAGQVHRLLFHRGGNVAFSLADAGAVVISALRSLAPNVAAKIPADVDARLLDLRSQSFATRTLRFADKVRLLAILLPPLAPALLAIAIAVAPRRRAALVRAGVALAVGGVAVFVDLALLRHSTLTSLFGNDELTDTDVREAAGVLWDAYVGSFSTWMLGLAGFGAIVAGVASGVLRPGSIAASLGKARERVSSPVSRTQDALAGILALAAGVLLLLWPTFVLELLAIALGVALIAHGLGRLLAVTGLSVPPGGPSLEQSAVGLATAAATLAILIGGVAIALAADGPAPSHAAPLQEALTCNGYAQLCDRRVNEVVFPGTHNSMSAANSPSWLIANQRYPVGRQLDDGIRAFKISTHYGIGSTPGSIRTDIEGAGERLNRVSEQLDAQARAALQRFSGAVGFGKAKGKRGVWLCHTLCELGATSMSSFLDTVARFLGKNPGTVLIFFDEDYVSEASLEEEFKRTGLFDRLAELTPGQPLPTLGELIVARHNILVFAQEPVSGSHPWDMPGFEWIQDTPLGAVKPDQFTCKLYRGNPQNPLLTMNDWADVFPPRRSPNLPLLKRDFIIKRARQCESERHRLPNLILTDFYDSGDVIGAARELNGLGQEKPTPIVPVVR